MTDEGGQTYDPNSKELDKIESLDKLLLDIFEDHGFKPDDRLEAEDAWFLKNAASRPIPPGEEDHTSLLHHLFDQQAKVQGYVVVRQFTHECAVTLRHFRKKMETERCRKGMCNREIKILREVKDKFEALQYRIPQEVKNTMYITVKGLQNVPDRADYLILVGINDGKMHRLESVITGCGLNKSSSPANLETVPFIILTETNVLNFQVKQIKKGSQHEFASARLDMLMDIYDSLNVHNFTEAKFDPLNLAIPLSSDQNAPRLRISISFEMNYQFRKKILERLDSLRIEDKHALSLNVTKCEGVIKETVESFGELTYDTLQGTFGRKPSERCGVCSGEGCAIF